MISCFESTGVFIVNVCHFLILFTADFTAVCASEFFKHYLLVMDRVRNLRSSSCQRRPEFNTDNQIAEHGCPLDDHNSSSQPLEDINSLGLKIIILGQGFCMRNGIV